MDNVHQSLFKLANVNKNEPSFSFDVNEPSDIFKPFSKPKLYKNHCYQPPLYFVSTTTTNLIHNSLINLASGTTSKTLQANDC
jgi:Golgi nucleoside diphosphatase